jgi:PAS domain S-box-containing protein
MQPMSWLNVSALLVSSIVSTSVVFLALGAGPRRLTNLSLGLVAAAEAAGAACALLANLSPRIGLADAGLLVELAFGFYCLLGPLLLAFCVRHVGAGRRAADVAATAGIVAVAALCFPLFRHEVLNLLPPGAEGGARFHLLPAGIVAIGGVAAYFGWCLVLLARGRRALREPFLALGAALLFAGVADPLLRPSFPLMTLCQTASILSIGYAVARRQVLSPLRQTAAALRSRVAARTRALEEAQGELEERVRARTSELEREVSERRRAEAALQERARRLELLARVGQQTTGILDLDQLLHQAARLVSEAFDYYNVSIFLADGESILLRAASREEMRTHEGALRLKIGVEGITGTVAGTGAPLVVPDVEKDARYTRCDDRAQTRSELAVPIRVKGAVVGVLDAQSAEVGVFTDLDVFTLQAVADQLAVAIENAGLYSQARSRAERLAVVNRIASAVGSTLELDELLRRVAVEVGKELRPDAFLVALYDEASGELDFRYSVDEGVVAPRRHRPLGTGLSSRVIEERRPVLIRDVPTLQGGELARWGTMKVPASWLGVPMRLGDRVTGVICVQAYRPNAYGEEEQLLLLTVADQVAVAVERARLYEAVRRELVERTAAEEKFRTLAEQSPNMIFINVGGRVVYANERCTDIVGYTSEELLAPGFDFMRLIAPESAKLIREAYALHLRGAEVPPYEYVVVARDGRRRDSIITTRLVSYGGERGILGIITDISHRKRTERLLQGLNAAALVMERVMTTSGIFPAVGDELRTLGLCTTVFLVEQDGATLRLEYSSRGPSAAGAAPATDAPAGFPADGEPLLQTVRGREAVYCRLPRCPALEARSELVASIVAPLIVEEAVTGLLVVQSEELTPEDRSTITAFANQVAATWRKTRLVEELERRLLELRRTQEQLLHAQKMEAIGRLAGGVAHDFNNLLTAIGGYAELLLEGFGPGVPERSFAEQITAATAKAGALTRQLLAFSRKQVVELRTVDLNEVVRGMEVLLRRLIGEHIELAIELDPGLGMVRVDVTQIEQAVMNLAINAGDAMARGGRLTIETMAGEVPAAEGTEAGDTPPGRYVTLAVSDTGVGMGPEVRSHLFEPFFTTKERGKGTGLGLSTVYGIVKQAGGHIRVHSEPGAGSTFSLSFPCAEGQDAAPDGLSFDEGRLKGSETIMVVEDEQAVRELATSLLRGRGYTVLVADRGSEALRVCSEQLFPIHLVVTDIVMPGGMSGLELADRLAERYPAIRLLCISGYAPETLAGSRAPGRDVPLLQKPFTSQALARKVREVLDAPR